MWTLNWGTLRSKAAFFLASNNVQALTSGKKYSSLLDFYYLLLMQMMKLFSVCSSQMKRIPSISLFHHMRCFPSLKVSFQQNTCITCCRCWSFKWTFFQNNILELYFEDLYEVISSYQLQPDLNSNQSEFKPGEKSCCVWRHDHLCRVNPLRLKKKTRSHEKCSVNSLMIWQHWQSCILNLAKHSSMKPINNLAGC